jgi:hypothetical protein
MNFKIKDFYRFCSQLRIESKENGMIRMDRLLGTQTYVMDEITKGLADDVHMLSSLKVGS